MSSENVTRDFLSSFTMTNQEFALFRDLVYQLVGINLNDTKKMLLVSRLSKRLRTLGLKTFKDYYKILESQGETGEELGIFINQVTTNKTDFFREEHHFHYLSGTILPRLFSECSTDRKRNIRIWSAGCSTGEEPYTLAMVLCEYMRLNKVSADVKILATDIDTGVLEHAVAGRYKSDRIGGISPDYLHRYFSHEADGSWLVGDELRSLLKFGRLNLMHPFPFKYGFDVIFCRNVLIYFTPEDRKKLVGKYCEVLRPNGNLALGHSESLVTEGLPLKNLGTTMYQLLRGGHA